jgi:hypothetical protein
VEVNLFIYNIKYRSLSKEREKEGEAMQKEILEHGLNINRRRFLSRLSLGIGSAALGSLLIPDLFGGGE